MAPVVLVASTLVIVVIAPLLATDPAFGWSADLFAVVFLLLLGSVAFGARRPRHRAPRSGAWVPAGP